MPEWDTPYRPTAEAVVATCLDLIELIVVRRPELLQLRGRFVVSFDVGARTIVVSVPLPDGRIVFVERILVDPTAPDTFGASELPMAIAERVEPTH